VKHSMTTDPAFIAPRVRADQIRAEVARLLSQLPDITAENLGDVDAVAARLEEVHEVLVRALESVEKG
jgi:hypothetical protein